MALLLDIWNSVLIYAKDTILLILGVLGGAIVSLYFFRKGLVRPELSYALDHDRLIWVGPDFKNDLETFFKGIKVNDPRRVTYFFWNSGNKIIEGSQITKADPLRIGGSKGNTLLAATVIKQSRPVINVSLIAQKDSTSAEISFDFLEPKDGFIVECFYDKTSEYKQWRELFEIKGTVKEAGEIVSRDLNFEDTRADSIKGKTIALLISLSSLTTLIFQVYEIYETTILILIVPKIITALVLLVTSLIATGVLASGIISRKIPRNLLRKEAKSSIKRIGNSIEIIDSSIDEIENDYKYFRRKED